MLTKNFYPLWLSLITIGAYLAILILVAEYVHRHQPEQKELSRKIFHIGAGNVILWAWWLHVPAIAGIAAAIIAAIISIISYFLPLLPSINSVGRKSLGTFFYAISFGVLMGWFWWLEAPQYAVIGILVMAWGDGMAALIGQKWGHHPYTILGIKKSWEGSLAMAGFSFLVTMLIISSLHSNIWENCVVSLVVALTATFLESFSRLGVDNLTVPLGSASLSFFLVQYVF